MSLWLAGAAVLVALLVPLGLAAAARTPGDGLVALQLAGTIRRWPDADGRRRRGELGDLALVLAVGSFIGSLAYATILGRSS